MFNSKELTSLSNEFDCIIGIEGMDIYNSNLLYKMSKNKDKLKSYLITVYENRVDLLSLDIYGDINYLGFLLLANNKFNDEFKIGDTIKYFDKNNIKEWI